MSYDRQSSISHYDPFWEDWGKWIDNAPIDDLKRELRNAKRRVKYGPNTRLSPRTRARAFEQTQWLVNRMTAALEKRS